jgi:hypothetical protein
LENDEHNFCHKISDRISKNRKFAIAEIMGKWESALPLFFIQVDEIIWVVEINRSRVK